MAKKYQEGRLSPSKSTLSNSLFKQSNTLELKFDVKTPPPDNNTASFMTDRLTVGGNITNNSSLSQLDKLLWLFCHVYKTNRLYHVCVMYVSVLLLLIKTSPFPCFMLYYFNFSQFFFVLFFKIFLNIHFICIWSIYIPLIRLYTKLYLIQ